MEAVVPCRAPPEEKLPTRMAAEGPMLPLSSCLLLTELTLICREVKRKKEPSGR